MKLTLNKRSALFVLRAIRTGKSQFSGIGRTDIIAPDPNPGKRWTKKLMGLEMLEWDGPTISLPLDVVVSTAAERLESKHAINTVYSGSRTLPPRSFIEVHPGLAISCPELLFVEMASILKLPEHLMLGFELCGGFSRDPNDPVNGPTSFGIKPVTNCAKLASYLEKIHWVPGASEAQRTLNILADNAWSPTEAIVATMASLPFAEFGYELGPCTLNERVRAPNSLLRANEKESRVPDIIFGDSTIGINYDGAVHLDLNAIVDAAIDVGRSSDQPKMKKALDQAIYEVRAKVVDDIRRNRELAAAGYTVFPIVKEDLYEEDGLDHVMLQVIEALEKLENRDMSNHLRMMSVGYVRKRRQELIWSLLPGRHRTYATDRGDGLVYYDEPVFVGEMIIGF